MAEPTGTKYDGGKPRVGLISDYATFQEAAVMNFGAQKYAAHNWRGGIAWSRLIDSAFRHLHAFNAGEDFDRESGLSHLAHARCCISFLLEYTQTHPELDDRYNFVEAVNNKKAAAKEAAESKEPVREVDTGQVPKTESEGEVRTSAGSVPNTGHVQSGLGTAERSNN